MASSTRRTFCGSPEHAIDRRSFLTGATVGAAALASDMTKLDALAEPSLASQLKGQQKRVILLWLAGGASQLETWDPKPGRPTGGPFASIPTSVPGVRICELMPKMAQRMHHTCILRSLNTGNADHGAGARILSRGRPDEPNLKYPELGAMLARELAVANSPVPDNVSFYTATEGRNNIRLSPAFLGPRYAPLRLESSSTPVNLHRLESISELDHSERAELRTLISKRFARGRHSSALDSHQTAYSRVRGLMASDKLFDVSGEPPKMHDLYGPTQFGQQALATRRLIEAGVPFVRLARAWWDSHGENFESHQELVPELDQVMAALLDDLTDRGLLEHTLVITLAEFGRTPKINMELGRDHFAAAWSATLSGCGVQGGAVYGKTDQDGQEVVDGQIGAGDLFATIFQALGIDHQKEYHVGDRPIPLTNPGTQPVTEVLL